MSDMRAKVLVKVELKPIIEECLLRHPLPHPRGLSDWYSKAQEYCDELHGFAPTRRQLAAQLRELGFRQVLEKGFANWVKPSA